MRNIIFFLLIRLLHSNVIQTTNEDLPFDAQNSLFDDMILFDEIAPQTFTEVDLKKERENLKDLNFTAEAKHGDDLNAVSSTTSENPFVGNYAELTIESNTSTIAPLETTGTNVPKKEVQEEVYEKKNEELTVVESSGVEAENFEMENRTSTVVSTGNSESDNSAEMMEKDEGSAEPDGDETSTESVKIKNSTEESANRSAEIVLESAENFTYESSEPFEAKMTVEAFLQTIPEMHVTANDNTPTTSSSTTTLASTTVTDASVKNCPLPRLCAKNCFIAINEDGCQDCQCLWQSIICESDSDCPDRQLCDLGHCNCKPGFKQDMRHSAKCEVDLEHSLKTNEVSIGVENRNEIVDSVNSKKLEYTDDRFRGILGSRSLSPYRIWSRHKRNADSSESLQWAGSHAAE